MSLVTRDFGDNGGWAAGCQGAPPPLDVVDDNPQARWWPLPRLVLRPQPPGPQLVTIPISAPYGDDPTDPTAQTEPRVATAGMIGFLNARPGPGNVRGAGVRQ